VQEQLKDGYQAYEPVKGYVLIDDQTRVERADGNFNI